MTRTRSFPFVVGGVGVGSVSLGVRGLALAGALALVFENNRGERRMCGGGV